MNLEELFPIRVEITQDIIDNSNRRSVIQCIGAKTLQSVLQHKLDPEHPLLEWGSTQAYDIVNGKKYIFGTEENVNMMNIVVPQFVTLTVKPDYYEY